MLHEWRRNPYYVGAERDLHLMHVCELLLDRYLADEYSENCLKHHRAKWGNRRSFWEPSYDDKTGDIAPGDCRLVMAWPNATNPRLEKKASKELKRCFQHERMLRNQDIQYLFRLLSKHYRRWE